MDYEKGEATHICDHSISSPEPFCSSLGSEGLINEQFRFSYALLLCQ